LAALGLCYLEVDQHVYLHSQCDIESTGAHGSFSIGTGNITRPKFFAYVLVDNDGTAGGYWNGPEAESHADDNLGRLTRSGACWQNSRAKVCAWR
jgi:hypothetical protein